jgi:hypothetical protein
LKHNEEILAVAEVSGEPATMHRMEFGLEFARHDFVAAVEKLDQRFEFRFQIQLSELAPNQTSLLD